MTKYRIRTNGDYFRAERKGWLFWRGVESNGDPDYPSAKIYMTEESARDAIKCDNARKEMQTIVEVVL